MEEWYFWLGEEAECIDLPDSELICCLPEHEIPVEDFLG